MDDGDTSVFNIIFFIILLFFVAILTGFNKAIYIMNEKEIDHNVEEQKDRRSIILKSIIERDTIYINSIQMITTLVELIMGFVYLPKWIFRINHLLINISWINCFGEKPVKIISVILATMLLMYIILTFGILFPKKVAQKYPDKWGYCFVMPVHFLRTLLYPFTGIVAISANLLMSVLGMKADKEQSDVTEEEIISMVNEGHEQGVFEAGEVEMINNIFEFGDKEASDIMTHRNNITAIESSMLFKDALNFMLKESNSRYPVYEENLDHIIGILYLKDAMRMHTSDESLNKSVGKVKGLIREASFVPETKNIDDLFRSMQSDKNQMVIVMDEYGQTSGLVTMEDILEEIVGNIMDEYDSEENHIEEKGENEYLVEGMMKLEDLEQLLKISFGDTEYETLNGFIISKLDRIPNADEESEVKFEGFCFKIAKVERNVIQSVVVTKLTEETERVDNETEIEPKE
ncbi:MAG: hemolysin family protein [Lachnospiraceae bacterium]|nr:hemolysin family protein [Lachnospiraceae bacterium]